MESGICSGMGSGNESDICSDKGSNKYGGIR